MRKNFFIVFLLLVFLLIFNCPISDSGSSSSGGNNGGGFIGASGDLDTSFNPGSGVNGMVWEIKLQSDNRILIGGVFDSYNGVARNCIARLNSNGSLDGTFNPGSGVSGGAGVLSLALQSDGKILIGGEFTSYNGIARNCIARLNADGSLDGTFNPGSGADNYVLSLVVQPDNRILIGGGFNHYNGAFSPGIARLNNVNGGLDGTFVPGSGVSGGDVYSIALQPDGKILIGGDFTSYNGVSRNCIARLNADGTLDGTFNPGSGVSGGDVCSVTLQADGKILIGGNFISYNGVARNYIARLNADGTLDGTFVPGSGVSGVCVYSIALQPDGNILIGGCFSTYNGISSPGIARLNTNGIFDNSFDVGLGVLFQIIYSVVLQSNGNILIGGAFNSYNLVDRNGIARIIGN